MREIAFDYLHGKRYKTVLEGSYACECAALPRAARQVSNCPSIVRELVVRNDSIAEPPVSLEAKH